MVFFDNTKWSEAALRHHRGHKNIFFSINVLKGAIDSFANQSEESQLRMFVKECNCVVDGLAFV